MSEQARVLIVDDHAIVRFGLAQILDQDSRFVVCGEAASVAEGKCQIAACRPDLVIFDLLLGGRDGLELLEQMCALQPDVRILVFSAQPELVYAPRAFKAGAFGYLMKDAGIEKVPEALVALLEGERYASHAVQRALFQSFNATRSSATAVLDDLSNRELQVLHLLGAGLGSAEIASSLSLSIKTVGTYRERLKEKLGVETALQLERRAADFIRTGSL